MRKSLLLFMFLIAAVHVASAAVVTYTPDNTTVFPNPERGFLIQSERVLTLSKPRVFSSSISTTVENNMFTDGLNANMRLMLMLYYLDNFKNQDLPDAILNGFEQDMQILRTNGWKCVLRFAYGTNKNDAELQWVQRHLEQLEPHLAANADVIYVIEAGFIGAWGEWYYTVNFSDNGDHASHLNANRRSVIDALLAHTPADRFVLLRTPLTKVEYLGHTTLSNSTSGIIASLTLTASNAFNGSDTARLGHHNDAFLSNYGDEGTYYNGSSNDAAVMRQYVADETLYVPNGGETNITNDNLAEQRYADAPAAMSTYHWSFCKSGYAYPMTDRWRSSGIYDTLNVHMGYRYNLLDAQFSDAVEPGGTMDVTINLCNSGYAPIYNERTAYLVLKNGSTSYSLPLTADPRRWLPNNAISTIQEQVSIPSDIPEGTYHLYLHLPDKYASIAADPRYAVRFANTGIWDAVTGMNDLCADIVIETSTAIGDVNSDGVVNVMDATALIGAYLNNTTDQLNLSVADVNHDGVINVMDATEIINIYLNNR